MDRSVELTLEDGSQISIVYDVIWEKEIYGQDIDGNRGEWREFPEKLDGIKVYDHQGQRINEKDLSVDDKLEIYEAIESDLRSITKEDFEREYDPEDEN